MGLFKKPPPPPTTLIAAKTVLYGDLQSRKVVTIEGIVEGTVRSETDLEILASGRVHADVECENLRCEGSGEGTLVVRGTALFGASSRWSGTFRAARLRVFPGARLQGTFGK